MDAKTLTVLRALSNERDGRNVAPLRWWTEEALEERGVSWEDTGRALDELVLSGLLVRMAEDVYVVTPAGVREAAS
jgi:hypothetical protein